MKMYVLVRNDLNPSYQAVQAGHALAEYMLQDSDIWKNNTLSSCRDVYRYVPKSFRGTYKKEKYKRTIEKRDNLY